MGIFYNKIVGLIILKKFLCELKITPTYKDQDTCKGVK